MNSKGIWFSNNMNKMKNGLMLLLSVFLFASGMEKTTSNKKRKIHHAVEHEENNNAPEKSPALVGGSMLVVPQDLAQLYIEELKNADVDLCTMVVPFECYKKNGARTKVTYQFSMDTLKFDYFLTYARRHSDGTLACDDGYYARLIRRYSEEIVKKAFSLRSPRLPLSAIGPELNQAIAHVNKDLSSLAFIVTGQPTSTITKDTWKKHWTNACAAVFNSFVTDHIAPEL